VSDLWKRRSDAFQDPPTVDPRCSWGARLFRDCSCCGSWRRAATGQSVRILADLVARLARGDLHRATSDRHRTPMPPTFAADGGRLPGGREWGAIRMAIVSSYSLDGLEAPPRRAAQNKRPGPRPVV
jgi:hypothetical protein